MTAQLIVHQIQDGVQVVISSFIKPSKYSYIPDQPYLTKS